MVELPEVLDIMNSSHTKILYDGKEEIMITFATFKLPLNMFVVALGMLIISLSSCKIFDHFKNCNCTQKRSLLRLAS